MNVEKKRGRDGKEKKGGEGGPRRAFPRETGRSEKLVQDWRHLSPVNGFVVGPVPTTEKKKTEKKRAWLRSTLFPSSREKGSSGTITNELNLAR